MSYNTCETSVEVSVVNTAKSGIIALTVVIPMWLLFCNWLTGG